MTLLASLRSLHPLFRLCRHRVFGPIYRRLARALDVPIFVRLDGIAYPVCLRLMPNLSTLIGRCADYERPERENFRRFVSERNAQVLRDVGANYGLYTLEFLTMNPQGRVLGLEPDERNQSVLTRTIRRSSLPATLLPAAASACTGRATFLYDDISGATGGIAGKEASFLQRNYGMTPRAGAVGAVALDDLLDQYPWPDILKIDTEGHEYEIFQGATRLLTEIRPLILFELSSRRDEVFRTLAHHEYELRDAQTLGEGSRDSHNLFAIPR